jgi:hypothetical protein
VNRDQSTPGEQLVWGNAMPTSHQAYRTTDLLWLLWQRSAVLTGLKEDGGPRPLSLNAHNSEIALGAPLASSLSRAARIACSQAWPDG